MKTYYIKQGKYYIQEGRISGMFHRVLELQHATEFYSLETVENYIQHDLCLNLNNVTVVVVKTITTQNTMVLVNNKWYTSDEVDKCSHCGEYFLLQDLTRGVVDKETGLELYCEECQDKVEFIVGNQLLDEEVA